MNQKYPGKEAEKEKILIVDDEKPICSMLKKFLTIKGYEPITVINGENALEKIKKERPRIILLDIRMPGMDGIQTLKRIKELDNEAGVIMITAVKDEETGKRCIDIGAYDYITKPLDLDYLERVLMVKLIDFETSH